jgi:CrcB protein
MDRFLLVAAGGGLGAAVRYGVGLQAARLFGPGAVWGTLSVNVLGGLLMGMLAGWLAARGVEGERLRLLLGVGVLGGFTTFSAFSLETFGLLERRAWAEAGAYVVASVALSTAALAAGVALGRGLV